MCEIDGGETVGKVGRVEAAVISKGFIVLSRSDAGSSDGLAYQPKVEVSINHSASIRKPRLKITHRVEIRTKHYQDLS